MKFRFTSFGVTCLLGSCALWFGCAAQSKAKPTQGPSVAFQQADSTLNEVSGIEVVRSQPALWWMHNDSGDSPRVFAVNKQGKIALTVNLVGGSALDWEDMAAQKGWVYMGDIGDNLEFRPHVQIYRFKSPTIAANSLNQKLNLPASQWEMTSVSYPDGSHNCESLAVTPDGRMLFVTKEESGTSGFYVWDKPWKGGTNGKLTKIGTWTFGPSNKRQSLATGADFSSNGRKLVVTTYTDVYEFPLKKAFDFSSLKFSPQKQALPDQKQCEAVCYSLDGRSIYSTGEGQNAKVWVLPSKLK